MSTFAHDSPPKELVGKAKVKRVSQYAFQWPLFNGAVVISGSTDDLYTKYDTPFEIADAKTVSVGTYAPKAMVKKYSWQMSAYRFGVWHGFGQKGKPKIKIGLVIGEVDRETDTLFDEKISYQRFGEKDLISLADIKARVQLITEYVALIDEEGPAGLRDLECSPGGFSCPVARFHEIIAPIRKVEESDIPEEVEEALANLRTHKQTLLNNKHDLLSPSAEKAAKAVIKSWALDFGVDSTQSLQVDEFELSLSTSSTSEVVQITPDELIDLVGKPKAKKFIVEKTTTPKFTISPKKGV